MKTFNKAFVPAYYAMCTGVWPTLCDRIPPSTITTTEVSSGSPLINSSFTELTLHHSMEECNLLGKIENGAPRGQLLASCKLPMHPHKQSFVCKYEHKK